ncbi:ABC-2 type transport system permease protein [Nonomuraea fuscirosea]|uniref:ABC-2 type transport system permease protein n=1 Tax=Nonomuraea fuscirosea TaxID=1291556 RepID=A0A2T0NAZ7_9ACTN|nr:ABC transporter permease [Nonomuraea fuscirosea]PRX70169.1 ABC-2 type transport system permease protein [Nonomuraea fuscirosea]
MIAIAWVNLVRLFRARANIFFVIVFPMVLIMVLGLSFGSGFVPKLGVAGGAGARAGELVAALERTGRMEVVRVGDDAEARELVERGRLAAALIVPEGYEGAMSGRSRVALPLLSRNEPSSLQLGAAVRSVVQQVAMPARAAAYAGDGSFDQRLARAQAVQVPGVTVSYATIGARAGSGSRTDDGFVAAASTQLLLFTFLTSLTGATALIETRRYGVSRRMYATPMPGGRILLGEAAGRVAVALAQGLIIMLGSALIFGVRWGDPLGAAALLLAFSLVGGGAGMLLGAAMRTEQQALSLGLLLGLGLGAIGGAMVPLDLLPATMRQVAHLTPHAWAMDGFAELLGRNGTIATILPQLGVLAGYAAALFALGTWRLRAALTR